MSLVPSRSSTLRLLSAPILGGSSIKSLQSLNNNSRSSTKFEMVGGKDLMFVFDKSRTTPSIHTLLRSSERGISVRSDICFKNICTAGGEFVCFELVDAS
ncbi:hypothetical protein LguiA_026123 [Lonicera macranthoides]